MKTIGESTINKTEKNKMFRKNLGEAKENRL